ncbi:hypothetical protein B0J14DRAFT_551822 [Halenospora varia]|nr:hypothetical protein B0J14DRAFT_551822 [Halenospora varia]
MRTTILLAGLLAATASADCPIALLKNATANYVQAQTVGAASGISAHAANTFTYTENFTPVPILTSTLSIPMTIDHSRSIHDPVLCATFTELIMAKQEHPYVIGTRMVINATEGKISLMESIVTDKGDWAFNATGTLYWNSLESWPPIPLAKQDTRATIQAAGDAYFNRFANVNVSVPFGTPCARLEGGAYTGQRNMTSNTCNLGLPSTLTVTDRRYVIDQEMGVVSIFLGFPGLDRSQGQTPMPDGHMFRVEGGMIRYIHTVSSCVSVGCGMNGTGPPGPS